MVKGCKAFQALTGQLQHAGRTAKGTAVGVIAVSGAMSPDIPQFQPTSESLQGWSTNRQLHIIRRYMYS